MAPRMMAPRMTALWMRARTTLTCAAAARDAQRRHAALDRPTAAPCAEATSRCTQHTTLREQRAGPLSDTLIRRDSPTQSAVYLPAWRTHACPALAGTLSAIAPPQLRDYSSIFVGPMRL